MVFHRSSKQRQVILDELRRLPGHPSASEIYDAVRKQLPNISLGTVYRNLDYLTSTGAIRKLDLGFGQARFDSELDWHLHIRCVKCQSLTDLPKGDLEMRKISEKPQIQDHQVLGIRAEYVGICPKCRQSLTPAERAELSDNWSCIRKDDEQPNRAGGC